MTDFGKILKYQNFIKTGPHGQTDMTKLIFTFHTFANAPKYATFSPSLHLSFSQTAHTLNPFSSKPQTHSNRINVHNEV